VELFRPRHHRSLPYKSDAGPMGMREATTMRPDGDAASHLRRDGSFHSRLSQISPDLVVANIDSAIPIPTSRGSVSGSRDRQHISAIAVGCWPRTDADSTPATTAAQASKQNRFDMYCLEPAGAKRFDRLCHPCLLWPWLNQPSIPRRRRPIGGPCCDRPPSSARGPFAATAVPALAGCPGGRT
jgi:hypothetical protein